MEYPKFKKHVDSIKDMATKDLEWNLKIEKENLDRLLSNGGASFKEFEFTEKIIKDIKEELAFRVENN